MKPNYECIVTGGGTTVEGEICIWQGLEKDSNRHLLFRDGKTKSIYAMAISPSGRYLATGSKNGLVRVWLYLNRDLRENAPFLFETYHQLCPVTALAFLTDDLLLSAGVNGKIRVISIDQKKHIKELDVHSGAICSLVALGSKVVASLGFDGNLKIWDMDSLSCEFQKEGFLFPKDSLSLFPSMAFSEEAGYLSAPSSDGKLHLFDLQDLCLHKTFQAHQNAFYAMTVCGKYLVTGGMGDHKLKVWDPRGKMPLSELETGTSFLRLCSVGRGKVSAICLDPNKSQSLRLFSVPALRPSGTIKGLSLRSLATLPVPVMEHLMNIELTRRKNNLIDQAKSQIMNPERMEPFLKQLADKGFWAEAKLLQAESAKLRNNPLHELGFLLQLTSAIKISQITASVFHRLAILLEQLNEPKLASQNYEKIIYFLEGIEEIINRLKAHPLIELNPKKAVRSDISNVELAVQEMEKDSVLKRPFRWKLMIPSRKQQIFTTQVLHNLDLWEEHIKAKTSSVGRSIEMEQETVALFDGQNTRELKWLRMSQIGIECPSPYLDYAIEIIQKNRQARGYGIFNPNKKIDSADNVVIHNIALAKAYRSIFKQIEVGSWLNQVHESMKELDRQSSFISR
jgi:hypothetical protein